MFRPVVDSSSVSPTHCPLEGDRRMGSKGLKRILGLQIWLNVKKEEEKRGGKQWGRCTEGPFFEIIATSQAGGEKTLAFAHTCQRQMLRINQRRVEEKEQLRSAVPLLTHYRAPLTGEQTAAHDNTQALMKVMHAPDTHTKLFPFQFSLPWLNISLQSLKVTWRSWQYQIFWMD